jgi:diguanylate cyclase (GGDEF)-like protein/PAS domain S-box-containing protein
LYVHRRKTGVATGLPPAFFELALGAVLQAVVATDLDGRVLYWNAAATGLYGYSAEEALGRLLGELVVPEAGRRQAQDRRERIAAGQAYAGEADVRDKAGRVFTVYVTSTLLRGEDGLATAVVGVAHGIPGARAASAPAAQLAAIVDGSDDAIIESERHGQIRSANAAAADVFGVRVSGISQARRAESELQRRALQDDLTGLANGALLTDRLDQALARRDRRGDETIAVVFADIDQFSLVNDSWGHAAADRLLVQVAERLAAVVRPGDTIARFGGDEFVLVCEDTDEAAARTVADQLMSALADPFHVDHRRAYVSASLGIALSPPHPLGDLLRFAAAAMQDAKSRGRARYQVFDAALAQDTADRLRLSTDLREALASNDLSLHYQPIVELATGRVVGVEALARWTHATRGPVPPGKFIALAEAIGLAPTLDRWALTTARGDLDRLRRVFGPMLRISVNISARHLSDDDLEDSLLTASGGSELTSGWLVLEITESAMMDNPAHARALLERLRRRDIDIAIDDFGTGYSSFGYLSRLPFTILKIDRSFIQHITTDPDALAIAASIIDLGRAVRLTTVAEGIETAEQLTLVRQLGCSAGQGYLWSPAASIDTLEKTMMALPNRRFDVSPADTTTVISARAVREQVAVEHGLEMLIRLHRDSASLTTITTALNAEGFLTPPGQRWDRATVARVISDIAYPDLWE